MTESSVFAALSDPTRRSVYERLTSHGPASASRLASELPVSRQAIAKHLAVLDGAGLVERSSAGREVVFSARLEPLSDVDRWMDEVGAAWDARLRDLRRSFD